MTLSHGPSIPINGLDLYLDVINPRSYPGAGATWNSLASSSLPHTLLGSAALTTFNGASCISCAATGNYVQGPAGGYTIPASYTMISWAQPLTDAQVTDWRTLWRTENGMHPVLIQDSTNLVGMYIGGAFRSFGYNVGTAGLESRWAMWTIAGSGGSTSLYIDDVDTGASVAFSAATGTHRYIGASSSGSQSWGYVSAAMIYGRRLSTDEIAQIFTATRGRYGL